MDLKQGSAQNQLNRRLGGPHTNRARSEPTEQKVGWTSHKQGSAQNPLNRRLGGPQTGLSSEPTEQKIGWTSHKQGSAQNPPKRRLGGPQTPGRVTAIKSAAAGNKTPISQHAASQFTQLHRLLTQSHKNKKVRNKESLSTDIKYKNGYRAIVQAHQQSFHYRTLYCVAGLSDEVL